MTAIDGIEPPGVDVDAAADGAAEVSAGVEEFVAAAESLPTTFIEVGAHPVLPATDHAVAEAIKEETALERRKDRARPWLLVALGGVYAILVGLGVWAAWTGSPTLDNLLRLFAVVMPVLTAAIGAAAAYYFTGPRGRG